MATTASEFPKPYEAGASLQAGNDDEDEQDESTLIQRFLEQNPLDERGLATATIYETNYGAAKAAIDLKRASYLSDFGLSADKEAHPTMRFGTYQDTLRRGGEYLSGFEGRSAGRGFLGGSGLARSGAAHARAAVADEKDRLMAGFDRTTTGFGTEERALDPQLALDLQAIELASHERELASGEFFNDPAPEIPEIDEEIEEDSVTDPAEAAADTAAGKTVNVAKAGRFAKKRLRAMRRAGLFHGSIPMKDVEAAAKFRRFNAKLTPDQRKLLKKKVK
jgi:hypothetical protein